MRAGRRAVRWLVLSASFAGLVATLAVHAVDNTLTAEDRTYIPKYLTGVTLPAHGAGYADEIAFIGAVQQAVLGVAPGNKGLPLDQPREPKDLYERHTGLCFDRSRVIEKILRYAGFVTRHVSLYAKPAGSAPLTVLLTPGNPSHAVTEVLTRAGWLVVDPNAAWVARDRDGAPVSIEAMRRSAEGGAPVAWASPPPWPIYTRPFAFVYGLYSRHGRFYPPYDFIPDIHYGEFAANFR